jgi:hypothetical protein
VMIGVAMPLNPSGEKIEVDAASASPIQFP